MHQILCLILLLALAPINASSAQEATVSPPVPPPLTDALMGKGLRYFEAVIGRGLNVDDGAWIKQQWSEQFSKTPEETIAHLNEMAEKLDLIEQGADPVALASYRQSVIDDAFCAAAFTSDPAVHRMKAILAPDDLVMAADCVYGFVVTSFDIDGLVGSHELLADMIAEPFDAVLDRQAVTEGIVSDFAGWDLADKELAAAGALRYAAAKNFWFHVDEQRRSALMIEFAEQANHNFMSAARNLEALALQKIGEVDHIEESGEAKLTEGMLGEYLTWLERIAGYRLSNGDRHWLKAGIAEGFRDDPSEVQQEAAGVERFNRDYAIEDDPGRQAAMIDGWTSDLHCDLTRSEDPDEVRLAEVIFRHDPVTHNDCASGQIARQHDAVLAEVEGEVLTEGMMAEVMRFFSLLLGRTPRSDEEIFARTDTIDDFKEDPVIWRTEFDDYRKAVKIVDDQELDILRAKARINLFSLVYCALKQANDQESADYLAMLQQANPIVYEDCDSDVIVTEAAVDAYIGGLNFLTVISGHAPLSQEEENQLVARIKEGQLGADAAYGEAGLLAFTQLWSWLNSQEKKEWIVMLRENGISRPSEAEPHFNSEVELAGLRLVAMKAKQEGCGLMAVITQGDIGFFVAQSGPSHHDPNYHETKSELGFSTSHYAHIKSLNSIGAALCG